MLEKNSVSWVYSDLNNIHAFHAMEDSLILDVIIGKYDSEQYKISMFMRLDERKDGQTPVLANFPQSMLF